MILVRGRGRQRLRYAARRFLQAIPILLAIVTCNFFLLHLAPGDAASVLAGESGSASEEYVAQLRHDFGLEKPLVLQYVDYVANVATLNFGYSFRYNRSNLGLIVERLATRTNNPYGKDPEELAQVLGYVETVEPLLRRGASLEVDTSVPLDQVVETILRHVRA